MTADAPRTRRAHHELTIEKVMTPQPMTIGRDQTLETAHRMMRQQGIRHLPVLEAGSVVGVISQRDLYFLETLRDVDPATDLVDDGMTNDVFTVAPNARVSEVCTEMAERSLGSAVVVGRGRVIGIFTATDALRLLSDR